VVEVHGDWRTASRLYGGESRKALSFIADRVAAWAVHHADRVRVVSDFTDGLARQAGARSIERFTAFMDTEGMLQTHPVEPPSAPRAVFVGSSERVKGADVLVAAWGRVRDRIPEAHLVMVGDGPYPPRLVTNAARWGIELRGRLGHEDVLREIDEARFLVVPSRSEGMARVIVEAFSRERPVIGADTGGIPELVTHGRTGLLVAPEDPDQLAEAIAGLLGDPAASATMGGHALEAARQLDPTDQFEAGLARLVARGHGR
jgi:glycosyltransferase involved in cell wall biosynthesis